MATVQQHFNPSTVQTIETAETATPRQRPFLRFFLALAAIPVITYLLAFPLVCLPTYEHWGATQWGPVLEYAFEDQPKNADVVIFGDSSAFLGVDPRIVNETLGIHSIVLPDTVGSIPVTGDKPLRYYLAHNRSPRLLVFYFSAWNLDFNHAAGGRLFEGEEMLLRHMPPSDILAFAREHPLELPAFPFRFYSTFGPRMLKAVLHHSSRQAATEEALGHVDYTEPFPPLQDGCTLPGSYLSQHGTASVQDLVDRFTTPETQVMVYLAPIPHCNDAPVLLNRSFAPLHAASPALLAPSNFAADPYFAHIMPASVPATTILFAQALQNRLAQMPAPANVVSDNTSPQNSQAHLQRQ